MKLNTLRLCNFRQYAEARVDFPPGLTAIVGHNGAGKSTLVEAIVYALYGELRVQGTSRARKTDVRWSASPPGAKFQVILDYEVAGRRYQLTRGEKETTLYDVVSGELIAQGITAVDQASERIIGLTCQQFESSFYAQQKCLAFLPDREKRSDQITRMLGYHRLRDASARAKDEVKGLKSAIETYERLLADAKDLPAERERAKSSCGQAERDLQLAAAELGKVREELPALEALQERANKWQKLGEQLAVLRERVSLHEGALQKELQDLEALSTQCKLRQTLAAGAEEYTQLLEERERILAAEKQRRGHAEQLGAIREQRATLRNLLQDMETLPCSDPEEAGAAVHAAQKRLEECAAAVLREQGAHRLNRETAGAEKARAEAQATAILQRLESWTRLLAEGKCPTCGQPTKNLGETVLVELQDEAERADLLLAAAITRLEQLEAEPKVLTEAVKLREEASAAHTAAQAAFEQLTKIIKERQRLQETIRQGEAALPKLGTEPDPERRTALESRLKEIEPDYKRFLSLANAEGQLAQAQAKVDNQRANLVAANREAGACQQARAQLGIESEKLAAEAIQQAQAVRAREAALAEREAAALQTLEERRQQLIDLENRLKRLEASRAELAERIEARQTYDVAADELEALRRKLIQELRPELQIRASEYLCSLTDGRYTEVQVGEGFEYSIVDGTAAKRVISGGEEDVLSLALRLALSELIQERSGQPLSLLVLDEVFGGLDAARRRLLLERLASLSTRFEQVIIISHIDEINELADSCVYVAYDPSTRSSRISGGLPGSMDLPDLERLMPQGALAI